MKRIAILGANGQVGTEVCLRLKDVDGIEVGPIARNVTENIYERHLVPVFLADTRTTRG